MHPVHTVKKKVASATTKKKVKKDIGEEFVEHKRLLESIQATLKAYCTSAEESSTSWTHLFKVQRDFVNNMTATYPRGDAVRATSQQYASNLTSLQSNFQLSDAADAPHKELHKTVEKYLVEIEEVQATYPDVELAYSEYLRYTTKSDRLQSRKKQNEIKVERNLVKRDNCKTDYDTKLANAVATMRAIAAKHPVVFQVAMVSFWLRNNVTMSLMTDHTGQMHSESDALKDLLLKVDLADPSTFVALLPSPGPGEVPLITYPGETTPPDPTLQITAPPHSQLQLTGPPSPDSDSVPPAPTPVVVYSPPPAPPAPTVYLPPKAPASPKAPVAPAPPAVPSPPPARARPFANPSFKFPPAVNPEGRSSTSASPAAPPPPPPPMVNFPTHAGNSSSPPPPPPPPPKRPVAT